jgi:putative ABC transport system substrate-binding protein
MTKKMILLALCSLLLASSYAVEAQQQTKIPRIGFIPSAGDGSNPGTQVKAFQQGLRDLGYIEGKNILIDYRYGEGQAERMPSLVAELVQLKVDMLVVGSPGAVQEAKKTSKTIPIVFVITQDPVAAGYVDSLARPGGNITGITRLTRDLSEKRLDSGFKRYEAAARTLKIPLYSLEVRSPKPDFEGAFQAAKKAGANALVTVTNIRISAYLKRIAELANANRLPSMFERSEYVEAGGLISYGASDKLFRRAAIYVDKILKGASPANLPVEQPTKFELVINLKTAKQIGFTIPPNILARADRVIR